MIIANFYLFEMNLIENDKIQELPQSEVRNEKKQDQLSPLLDVIQNDSLMGNIISFLNVFV